MSIRMKNTSVVTKEMIAAGKKCRLGVASGEYECKLMINDEWHCWEVKE